MIVLLATCVNWNRPLIAVAMICVTVIAYKIVAELHRWGR